MTKREVKLLTQRSSIGLGDGEACVYCGRNGDMSDEHVIPASLGLHELVTGVCRQCNNGFLSQLDRELCSRSPLALVAAEELGKDIDYSWIREGAMLIEGRLTSDDSRIVPYPQLILVDGRAQIRGDAEVMYNMGARNFVRELVHPMLDSFRDFEAGKKRCLFFQPVTMIPDGCQLPPRIFCKELPKTRKKRRTFIVRYLRKQDLRKLLNYLDTWGVGEKFSSSKIDYIHSSRQAGVMCVFVREQVVRALLKLGLNLLGYSCTSTPITDLHFAHCLDLVRGDRLVGKRDLELTGLVPASELREIGTASGTHEFWLLHEKGSWIFLFSFFGGLSTAKAVFPGNSNEDWCFARIVASYPGKAQWEVSKSQLLPSVKMFNCNVNWENHGTPMPSAPHAEFTTKEIQGSMKNPVVG